MFNHSGSFKSGNKKLTNGQQLTIEERKRDLAQVAEQWLSALAGRVRFQVELTSPSQLVTLSSLGVELFLLKVGCRQMVWKLTFTEMV